MGERKEVKVRLSSVILIFIILILLLVLGGMFYYYNYIANKNIDESAGNIDNNKTNTENVNNNISSNAINNVETNKTSTKLTLSKADKIDANKELNNKLLFIFRYLTDDDITSIKENTELLSSNENRALILWYAMFFDKVKFSEFDENGEIASGNASIDINTVNKYYYKVFNNGNENDFEEILNAYNQMKYFKVKDEKIYGSFPTGWGITPFVFKIDTIELDSEADMYTAMVYILRPINYNVDDVTELNVKYGHEDVLEWPEELNYCKLKIQYKKDSSGNDKLISMMFVK